MSVSKKYHQQVMYSLLGVLFVVFTLLIITLFKADFFDGRETVPVQQYGNDPASKYLEAPVTPFCHDEEIVVIEPKTKEEKEIILPVKKVLFEYIEVTDGCDINFEGGCLYVRSGPGTDYPVIARLRNNIVLKIDGKVERDGYVWYKVVFDEWLQYPERVKGDWYVAADYARVLLDEGVSTIWDSKNVATSSTKQIIVNRLTQKLYAYEGDVLFMMEKISTGLELTPTPSGVFTIFRKTPSRYMQGPILNVSDQYYDLPGVPWNLYFTHGGAVIHGAYWHDSFGTKYSHGCVNLPSDKARELYNWAELGTKVTVEDW